MQRVRRPRMASAVTIAGSDSGGGAGIQADLLTFAAHGVYGATVVVAGTAQNTRGIFAVEAFSPRFVARQLDAVFMDIAPAAVKIGMLCDAGHVRVVASGLRRHGARNVVADPVLQATSGRRLLSADGVRALVREILPLCDLVTPNLDEAAVLAGMRIRTDADRREAARRIAGLGARAVLVKGGHGRGRRIEDLLWDGRRFRTFANARIETRALHGTGCVLSAAVAANLALGRPMEEAVARAIRYLRAALRRGAFPGRGAGSPGHAVGVTPSSRSGSRPPSRRRRRSRS
ncbi:MAG TPA: bifunctional hydroxymethylpyrimidine kinase/phosphomethylpyrimidine kinase [Thermoanaerobaculia bacterium]|nr:bifunctional hydroxymethylpyrimidine kinase/phosphomethylpyrimidine kinase [Thermoanaerobaculia bacterium]